MHKSETPLTTTKSPEIPSDTCEASILRCRELTEEATKCPYGLERWVNAFDCEDCRCYNPCLTGPNQESMCPSDYQCIVDVITTDSGDTKYKASCRPGTNLLCYYISSNK